MLTFPPSPFISRNEYNELYASSYEYFVQQIKDSLLGKRSKRYHNKKTESWSSLLDFAELAEQEEKRGVGTYLLCPFLLVLFVLLEDSGEILLVLLSLLRCTEPDSCGYR